MANEKAIIILSGSLKQDKTGKWRTTSFNEGDDYGALGDRLRVIAGEYLYKDDENLKIFVLGGRGQLGDDAPPVSEVMKGELVERGVASGAIIIETDSGTTWQQLQFVKEIIKNNDFSELVLISNEYHLPRIQAMIESDKGLQNIWQEGKLKLQSAESVLIKKEPRWEQELAAAYERDDVKARIALEQKGVEDIREGRYKFK